MKKFFSYFFLAVIICVFVVYHMFTPMGSDIEHHLSHLKKSAEEGHANSQASVGDYYFMNREYKEALEYYRKAAEQGQASRRVSDSFNVCTRISCQPRLEGCIRMVAKSCERRTS